MRIYTYESNERGSACCEYLERRFSAVNSEASSITGVKTFVLLPIPTCRKGELRCPAEALDFAGDGVVYAGYEIDEKIREKLTREGAICLDSALDEDFLLANAYLTALGAVGAIIDDYPCAPEDLSVGVVGYGRIGKHLVRLLLSLGARVRVYTSSERIRLELCSEGVSARESCAAADLSGLDILINTAPANVFELSEEERPTGLRIIDLASGDSFPGVKTDRHPALPARKFPITAGRIWGESILRILPLAGGARFCGGGEEAK